MRIGRLALGIAAFLVCILLLELGVRWLAPQDPDFFNSHRFFEPIKGRFEQFVPHSVGNHVGVPVSINSLGMRDREVAVPKPAGLFRLLAIGDSVTFGFGVRLEDAWVKQLEARLRERFRERPVEVVNAGMGNTGLDYYVHVLQTRSVQLEPDLVFVGLALNDIMDYDMPLTTGWNAFPTLGQLHYALITHSHLYILSYARAKSALYRSGWLNINTTHEQSLLAVAVPSQRQRRAWVSSFALLEALIAEARGRRIPLALVVFPMEMQLGDRALARYRDELGFRLSPDVLDTTPPRRLAEFARIHDVPMIDLLPRFRGSQAEGLYYRNPWLSLDWVHPSVAGHRLAADEIFKVLEAIGSLPSGRRARLRHCC